MAKEPMFSNGKLNLRAWAGSLARRETGKRSADRQTVAQTTEILGLVLDDVGRWVDQRSPSQMWRAFMRSVEARARRRMRDKKRRR